MATVAPPKGVPKYECKQSKYEQVPSVPLRMMVVGPSGSGKSVFLTACLLDFYRGCFQRIFIFSPNVHVDGIWLPVKRYIKHELEVPEDEQVYFDTYEPRALEQIIRTQEEVVAVCKKKKLKKIYSVCIVIDDFADSPAFCKREALLHSLYTRGRHQFISTITSVQKYKTLATICRVNVQSLIVFRLRSQLDLDAILEELSALVDKKELLEMYREATAEPYSFLYCDLTAKSAEDIFWLRFEHPLLAP